MQPRRGAFTEIVEKTGGGLLVAPDDPAALAGALHELWADRDLDRTLGQRGFGGVRAHYEHRAVDGSLAGGVFGRRGFIEPRWISGLKAGAAESVVLNPLLIWIVR